MLKDLDERIYDTLETVNSWTKKQGDGRGETFILSSFEISDFSFILTLLISILISSLFIDTNFPRGVLGFFFVFVSGLLCFRYGFFVRNLILRYLYQNI